MTTKKILGVLAATLLVGTMSACGPTTKPTETPTTNDVPT